MKFLIVFVALFAVALAAPTDKDATTNSRSEDVGVESHNFAFETSNGIAHSESGQLRNAGADNESYAVKGSFSYVADDGVTYTVNYIADENGYQPQGAHLPVA